VPRGRRVVFSDEDEECIALPPPRAPRSKPGVKQTRFVTVDTLHEQFEHLRTSDIEEIDEVSLPLSRVCF
jgi:hypothetical protein